MEWVIGGELSIRGTLAAEITKTITSDRRKAECKIMVQLWSSNCFSVLRNRLLEPPVPRFFNQLRPNWLLSRHGQRVRRGTRRYRREPDGVRRSSICGGVVQLVRTPAC